MAKIRTLCGLIHSKFDSEAQFARALGWPRQRVNKITNGLREPTLDEVDSISKVLDESFEKIAYIFLSQKSPNGQHLVF